MNKICIVVRCEGSEKSLKNTVDSVTKAAGFAESAELILLFSQKKYAARPEVIKIAVAMEECSIHCFWGADSARCMETLAEYIKSNEIKILFFLHEGDEIEEYCLKYIDSFLELNHESCSTVLLPARREGEHMPKEFCDLAEGGVSAQEDGFDSSDDHMRVAVWIDDMQELGSHSEFGNDAFDDAIRCKVEKQGLIGRINQVEVQRGRRFLGISYIPKREYLVSCIIPIYNVEKYLEEAIESVINQTIGFEKNVQLILVNDGSPDGCGGICRSYLARYEENIVYIEQENQGVSAARNAGLDVAAGEYVAFLDGDDLFDEKYMELGVDFLRNHREEVDFVAFPRELFELVEGKVSHPLDMKFTQTRIVDLEEEFTEIHASCATALFKRREIGNIRFDTRLRFAEDGKFIFELLNNNSKYGLCVDTRVYVRRRNDGSSATQNTINNEDYWIKYTFLHRELIEMNLKTKGYIPKYLQYFFFYDIQWLNQRNVLKNIKDKMSHKILNELQFIMQYMDDEIIQNHNTLSSWHKLFLFKQKYDLSFVQTTDGILLYGNERYKFSLKQVTVFISLVEEKEKEITILGYYRFPEPESNVLCAIYDGKLYKGTEIHNQSKQIYLFGSVVHKTNVFELKIPFTGSGKISFYIDVLEQSTFPVVLQFTKTSRITKIKYGFAVCGTLLVKLISANDGISVEKATQENIFEIYKLYLQNNFTPEFIGKEQRVIDLFFQLFPILHKQDIWVFMDRKNAADDNAEHLFNYASKQNDSIKKYFVLSKDCSDCVRIGEIGELIYCGSDVHKLMILFATKYISSQWDLSYVHAFEVEKAKLFLPLIKSEFILLKHGITKDDVSSNLCRLNKNAKIFVTATYDEYNSILSIPDYDYGKDVVKLTGFPRYDGLYDASEKKIIFMPTWRRKLSNLQNREEYNPMFKFSDFYKRTNQVLCSEELRSAAKYYGYTLMIRLHPNMEVQREDFIDKADFQIMEKDYPYQKMFAETSLIITDYSSVAFDFAYLKKPVVYYQFDERPLGEGYYNYEQDGFGEVIIAYSELVETIIQYMKNGCKMKKKYEDRVEKTFPYVDKNNCQRVYNAIIDK